MNLPLNFGRYSCVIELPDILAPRKDLKQERQTIHIFQLQYLVLVSSKYSSLSWPLTSPPPQLTWTTKTWTTSWTTTASVRYPCRPSPKLHREVPKRERKKKQKKIMKILWDAKTPSVSDLGLEPCQVSYWSFWWLKQGTEKGLV